MKFGKCLRGATTAAEATARKAARGMMNFMMTFDEKRRTNYADNVARFISLLFFIRLVQSTRTNARSHRERVFLFRLGPSYPE